MDSTDICKVLKALSDPTRYQIMQLLLTRHHCSRSLSLALGISESAVSQHMSVLKDCGLVTGCRHRRHIHYMIDDTVLHETIDALDSWLKRDACVADCHDGNPCRFMKQGEMCK